MWVFEEVVEGEKLSVIINTRHENPKYLKGVALPHAVRAVTDPTDAAKDCTHLVFVLPHQFLDKLCATLRKSGVVRQDAVAISLIKGITFSEQGPQLVSESIKNALGVSSCAVLMGANVADEVARGLFSEATIGLDEDDARGRRVAAEWLALFHDPHAFRCVVRSGVAAIEVMGALKNVVALAAGIAEGLSYGNNCKAALMRIGFGEMHFFIEHFFSCPDQRIWWESCGIADLVTTCYGGRNVKCAAIFAKTGKSIHDIEKEVLNGQMLQGPQTLEEVMPIIRANRLEKKLPLFCRLYEIFFQGKSPSSVIDIA